MRLVSNLAVFAVSISLATSLAVAECKPSKLNSFVKKFTKSCNAGLVVNNEKIPATDAKYAQKNQTALDARDQALVKLHTSTDQKIDKILAKKAFYLAKKAEAIAACFLNGDFLCQAAINLAKKAADTALQIAKINEQEDQKAAKIDTKYNQTVAKNNSKLQQELAKLGTKLDSHLEKAQNAEHQAVVMCGIDPDPAPFVCDLLP